MTFYNLAVILSSTCLTIIFRQNDHDMTNKIICSYSPSASLNFI